MIDDGVASRPSKHKWWLGGPYEEEDPDFAKMAEEEKSIVQVFSARMAKDQNMAHD